MQDGGVHRIRDHAGQRSVIAGRPDHQHRDVWIRRTSGIMSIGADALRSGHRQTRFGGHSQADRGTSRLHHAVGDRFNVVEISLRHHGIGAIA